MSKSVAMRRAALIATTAMSVAWTTSAAAQTAQPRRADAEAADAADAVVKDIVVTGSRVKRDGYSAPTPETVLSADAISDAAPANLADFVNDLPALVGSSTPRTATTNLSSASAGSNFLNLRGLGANRTLILLDGRRVVGSNADQRVDANTLPTALVSRIDVVTGGASAAYGSDAVSGVVNFVLDTKFTGLKASAQSGITTYGDDAKWKVELTGGSDFADGKGHVLLSGSYSDSQGQQEAGKRRWFKSQKIIPNPAFAAGNGQPTLINASNVNIAAGTAGGLITTGALRGTQFVEGGAYRPFQFGAPAGPLYSIGGEPNDLAAIWQLEVPLEQQNIFGRASYDFSDAVKVFLEGSYSKAIADSAAPLNPNLGNLTIQQDNAFLPSALRGQLLAAGETNFRFGTLAQDIGRINLLNQREVYRLVGGLEGNFSDTWSYSVYGQYGRTEIAVDAKNTEIPVNFRKAIDAVRNSSGQIVCRVNQTTVTDAACVPYNPFGIGVNSQDAINYVSGTSSLRQVLKQKVIAATVQGEPFSTWAGPVSIALGAEYRDESIDSSVDALSQAGAFLAGNYKPTIGSYDVKEIFAEAVIPIAEDLPLLRKLELNAAARYTDYSTSGGVTTWKIGGNWSPFDDLRLRATVSRDIRAPNLNELFAQGVTSAAQTIRDGNTQFTGINGVTVGNIGLKPEVAKSLTVGGVYQPSWLPNFSISVDYYNVRIKDAIITLNIQQVYDRCSAGNQAFCNDIIRDSSGAIATVFRLPRNFAVERAKGIDFEGSYSIPVGSAGGRITIRALATHFITRTVSDGVSTDEAVGENAASLENTVALPKWRLLNTVGYDDKIFGAQLSARTVSSGVYDVTFTSATLADNRIPGATYFDLALAFKFQTRGGQGEFFFNVDNVFNKDPVIVSPLNQQFIVAPVNAQLYDVLGREFRAGIRFKL